MPATLRERGVAVPFTSPTLAGARVRLLEHRRELILPHPAGIRGVYIFALASLTEYCAPTLHDVRLAERLVAAFPLSPSTVRQAARVTAAEGAAGRAAAAAAQAALANETAHRTEMEAMLIRTVLDVDDPTERAASSLDARRAVLQVARRAGRTAEAIKADIDGLDGGMAPGARVGRCRQLVIGLLEMEAQVAAWRGANTLASAGADADAAISLAVAAGSALLSAAQAAIADLPGLLRRWAADPDQVASELARPDWLLDGWEPIWLMWRLASSDSARADALAEAGLIMPTLPAEMEAWFSNAPDLRVRLHAGGNRPSNRRSPAAAPREAMALIERNERMRALAA
jgi:hypothetical protein